MLCCPPPSLLLQPELNPGDAPVLIQVMAQWEITATHPGTQCFIIAAPGNSATRNDGQCRVFLLGQTIGLCHNHPWMQPGLKGITHPHIHVGLPLTWDEILLFGCREKSTSAP